LADPPGLHEAKLQGSAGVSVGLQDYLLDCGGYLQGCRVMYRVAEVTCRVAGVDQYHHTWRVAALQALFQPVQIRMP